MALFDEIKKFPFILAPLAGYTDHPFRLLCKEYGASLVYTEMISVHTMAKNNPKLQSFTHFLPEEKPIGVQLFGAYPELYYDAVKRAQDLGFDTIDINMGCPVPKVVGSGGGAVLMKDVPMAAKLVAETMRAATVPVSIKIRSGWDASSINFLELNKMAEDYGVSMITLHARTRSQMFTGSANWEHIAELKAKSKLFSGRSLMKTTGQSSLKNMKQPYATLNCWSGSKVTEACLKCESFLISISGISPERHL
jgi:tRNA-dihydrouridine synthase B